MAKWIIVWGLYSDLMNFWVQKIQLLLLCFTNGTKQQRRIDDSSHNSQMAVLSNACTHSSDGYDHAHIEPTTRSNAHWYPIPFLNTARISPAYQGAFMYSTHTCVYSVYEPYVICSISNPNGRLWVTRNMYMYMCGVYVNNHSCVVEYAS